MKYVICKTESANSNGIAVNEGHPQYKGKVCLCSTDIILCPGLEGTFEERVAAIGGTIYGSAKDVNKVIKNWNL